MTLLRRGGMCARLAADRSTLIFTKDGKKNTAMASLCARWPPQSAGSCGIFPCPAIFSQVLIFSSCQGRSRQPPHHFQSSGLHANCLSIAPSPPTYIMHLVSSARPGRQRPSSLTFRRDQGWKSNTYSCNRHSDSEPLRWVKANWRRSHFQSGLIGKGLLSQQQWHRGWASPG